MLYTVYCTWRELGIFSLQLRQTRKKAEGRKISHSQCRIPIPTRTSSRVKPSATAAAAGLLNSGDLKRKERVGGGRRFVRETRGSAAVVEGAKKMILPVAKLGTLLLKTMSKPIASRLKAEASRHPKFRQLIINLAQVPSTLFVSR
jgi:hypothetical protein